MKKSLLILASLSLVLFTGCSTKRVFEPKDVKDDWNKQGSLSESIIEVGSNIALLNDNTILTYDKQINVPINKEYKILSSSDGWVISAQINGDIQLQSIDSADVVKKLSLKKSIASASVDGDTLAILFADNEMALYSIESGELLLKEQGAETSVLDSRIISPYFLGKVVIFLTLDGKVVVISRQNNTKLRTSIVSSEDNFNNIIYFKIANNKIIALTKNSILSMSENEKREKYEIRNFAYDGQDIFITTKYGEIISLTTELNLNAKLKFPFAHFLGLIVHENVVYALEKEGYLIVAPRDLSSYEIYEVDVDEGFVFVGDTKFYVNDEFISVK